MKDRSGAIKINDYFGNSKTSLYTDSSKFNGWIKSERSTTDTITSQTTPSYPIDFRNGVNLFQWTGKVFTLDNGNNGLNIGFQSGFGNENTFSAVHVGHRASYSVVGDSASTVIGSNSSIAATGNYNSYLGAQSGFLYNGNRATILGYKSGSNTLGSDKTVVVGYLSGNFSNSTTSTFVGSEAGNLPDVTDTISGATGNYFVSRAGLVTWSGDSVKSFISAHALTIGNFYPSLIIYFGTIPQSDSAFPYQHPITVVDDSTIGLYGVNYNGDYGSGDFYISLFSKSQSNQQVLGYAAKGDSSNQVVLGNDQVTQIKFGGSAGLRLKTDSAYTSRQVPAWDTATKQFLPGNFGITTYNGIEKNTGDSVSLGGSLTQNTSIYGNNSYNFNLYPAHLNIGNAASDQTSAKMAVSVDSTASGPNTALGAYYTGTDPLLSNAWGYNALYAVGSVKFTKDPVPTSSYTFLAPILGKFTIPESTGSHYINSSASPVSSVAAVLNSENGNIGMSDFAFFYGGNNTLDPVKNTYTGHIDTLYGLFVTDPFAGQMGDSIRRAYGIYLGGSATYNYLAGHSGYGINTPTSAVDILGTSTDTGADLLRIRKSYTPTGADDTAGQVGSWAWDDSYIYVKTSSGWKRAALTTF